MKTDDSLKDEMSGSTAITVLIRYAKEYVRENLLFKKCLFYRDDSLFANNVGDSRCVACIDGNAMALSVDHKPGDDRERKRIESAGGFVEFNRVNGNLALSRALGDFAFKNNDNLKPEQQIVTGEGELSNTVINE